MGSGVLDIQKDDKPDGKSSKNILMNYGSISLDNFKTCVESYIGQRIRQCYVFIMEIYESSGPPGDLVEESYQCTVSESDLEKHSVLSFSCHLRYYFQPHDQRTGFCVN